MADVSENDEETGMRIEGGLITVGKAITVTSDNVISGTGWTGTFPTPDGSVVTVVNGIVMGYE